ncbi:hypothetical protein Tco_0720010 [Tanacetum coccineum]
MHRTLSPVRVDLLPPPKRIRDSDSVTDLDISSEEGYVPYVPIEVGLGIDIKDSYKPYTEPNVDSDIQADIDASEEEDEPSVRGMVEFEVDPRVRPVIDDDVRESVREDV